MQIMMETAADRDAIEAFLSMEEQGCSEALALRREGRTVCSLTAKTEDGAIVGYLHACEIDAVGSTQLLLTCCVVQPEYRKQGIGRKLLAMAHEFAEKQGYGWLFAVDDTGFLEAKAGYRPAAFSGFMPPDFRAQPESYLVYQLSPKAPELRGYVTYPEALGVRKPEVFFAIRTTMDLKEYEHAVLSTRLRKRIFERAVLILAMIICGIAAVWRQRLEILLALVPLSILLYRSIVDPARFAVTQVEKIRRSFGGSDIESFYFFTEDGIAQYHPNTRGCSLQFYQNMTQLYLKDTFLFLCNDAAKGLFLMYRDIPDRDALIGFLKQVIPDLRIRR